MPGGKVEPQEHPQEAAIRELFEETEIALKDSSQIHFLETLYMQKPYTGYVFHVFRIYLDEIPPVKLSREHQAYTWVSRAELKSLPLTPGSQEAFSRYHSYKRP